MIINKLSEANWWFNRRIAQTSDDYHDDLEEVDDHEEHEDNHEDVYDSHDECDDDD